MTDPILSLRGVGVQFTRDDNPIRAVLPLDLDVFPGEFVTVVGPSGCGKSTLLNVIVGLLKPTEGEILFKGQPLSGINPHIGYVTQADNRLSVAHAARERRVSSSRSRACRKAERATRARDKLIRSVGLGWIRGSSSA